jgi:choline-phosphate cytidylyltransferase
MNCFIYEIKILSINNIFTMIVITFGTFDLLHIGHINMLNRCKKYGDTLIVGVSSDELNYKKKGRHPIFCEKDRMEIIKNIKCVDQVFLEESLELKREYIKKNNADIFIIGDDWKNKFDELNDICVVKYLERTKDISTTEIIKNIKEYL